MIKEDEPRETLNKMLSIRIPIDLQKRMRNFNINVSAVVRDRLEQIVRYLEKQQERKWKDQQNK